MKLNNKDLTQHKTIEGFFTIMRTHKTEGVSIIQTENVVVDNARKILRDLTFGETPFITRLVIGDLGFEAGDAWDNPDPAIGDEVALVNQTVFVPVTTKEKIVDPVTGRLGILFTFLMPTNLYNGLDGTLRIVELGLSNDTNELFTKKNKPMISKDFETQLEIKYTLLF